ncbi:MAG TPA: putative toxin-antitoxin system toxin component, PIN family [Candidatus Acidoferrales bacterium]|nr:putative toxin-antitoxin system toxin component, PIN family [Candidatus Acidoferrales bacterium]
MRVVIDTNVLVSGIINPHGPPGRVIDFVVSLILTPLYDDRILSEYRDVLLRPVFGFRRNDVYALLDFVEFAGEHITAGPVSVVLSDPSDLPFVEVAIAGSADALVTGNTKHFTPARRHGVSLLTPAALLNLM